MKNKTILFIKKRGVEKHQGGGMEGVAEHITQKV